MIRPRDHAEGRRLRNLWWQMTVPVDDSRDCRVEAQPGHKVVAHTDQGTMVVSLPYAAELSACDPTLRCDGVCLPENFLWHRTCGSLGCIAHAEPLSAAAFSGHSHAPQPGAGADASSPAEGDDGGAGRDGGAGLGINAPRLDALRPLPASGSSGMRYARKNQNRARFSDDQAREIIHLRYREGWTYAMIAERFGAPLPTVVGCCRGKSYRDLLPEDVLARARQRRSDLADMQPQGEVQHA